MMHIYVCPNDPPCGVVVRTIVDADKHGAVSHICKTKRRNGQATLTPMVKPEPAHATQRRAS